MNSQGDVSVVEEGGGNIEFAPVGFAGEKFLDVSFTSDDAFEFRAEGGALAVVGALAAGIAVVFCDFSAAIGV